MLEAETKTDSRKHELISWCNITHHNSCCCVQVKRIYSKKTRLSLSEMRTLTTELTTVIDSLMNIE